jgi:hypothetical protein
MGEGQAGETGHRAKTDQTQTSDRVQGLGEKAGI